MIKQSLMIHKEQSKSTSNKFAWNEIHAPENDGTASW
jgi:hypothetical protein